MGDLVVEAPRVGTVAWLQLQEHVVLDGVEIPSVHRIPEHARIVPADDLQLCRVEINGARCRARPSRVYGICVGHLGGGGWRDSTAAREMSAKAHERKAVLRQRRALVGSLVGRDPRAVSRAAALERAADVAEALLAPLDDAELGAMARQRAAVTILDATSPLATASLEVQLPASSDQVSSLTWEQLQQLAGQLLDEPADAEYQLVPAVEHAQQ